MNHLKIIILVDEGKKRGDSANKHQIKFVCYFNDASLHISTYENLFSKYET